LDREGVGAINYLQEPVRDSGHETLERPSEVVIVIVVLVVIIVFGVYV
jgi:hypothetical protein